MLKLLSSAVFATVLASPALFAQDNSSVTPVASLPNAPATGTPRVMTTEVVPFVAINAGFSYLQTDLLNTQGAQGTYQMGWYGMPEVYFTKHISLIADFTTEYNWHAGQSDNIHTFMGGPKYGLAPYHHVAPFVFVEGGAERMSQNGTINWLPATGGGLGFNTKLTKMVSFQVIPGEYIATQLPNGNWSGNFNARAGFTFSMPRLAHKKI